VFGAFQEGSKDLHALLDTLVDSKLRAKGLARGGEGTEKERAILLSEFRRELLCKVFKVYKVYKRFTSLGVQ
jgi:hypothetical protein